ncbi:DUF4357 domain-containing protein [Nocardia sp. NPDC004722]
MDIGMHQVEWAGFWCPPACFDGGEGIFGHAQLAIGFTVRAGSQARTAWAGGNHSYGPLRKQLEDLGVIALISDGRFAVFTRDYVFRAPSAAAAMIVGRPTNGHLDWKVRGTGVTYGAWQDGQGRSSDLGAE